MNPGHNYSSIKQRLQVYIGERIEARNHLILGGGGGYVGLFVMGYEKTIIFLFDHF